MGRRSEIPPGLFDRDDSEEGEVKLRDGDTRSDAGEVMADFLNGSQRRRARRSGKEMLPEIEVLLQEAERRSKDGDWDGANGRTFVGLYALCYRLVYGSTPTDLQTKREIGTGSRLATSLLRDCFKGDAAEMVEFVKWTWKRESARRDWALRNGVQRNRFRVFTQFSKGVYEDYRIEVMQRRGRGR